MKKIITLLFALCLVLSVTACSSQQVTDTSTPTNTPSVQTNSTNESNNQQSTNTDLDAESIVKADSLEEIEANVIKDVDNSIASMTKEMESLAIEIDSFDKYKDNEDRIKGFYDKICAETLRLEICLMEYAVAYAEFIMKSDSDFDDKYDDLDELYDVVYEDAGDEIYDEIYDGILDDMYDIFYDGLLDEAYDSVPYDKWLDACSNEYEWWLDACSECYEFWLDTRSDIYEFWLDMRSATFGKDTEEAYEIISDFKEDIEDLKSDPK